MRALCYEGKERVRVETVPDPVILNPRDAIVKVTTTAPHGLRDANGDPGFRFLAFTPLLDILIVPGRIYVVKDEATIDVTAFKLEFPANQLATEVTPGFRTLKPRAA